MKLTKKKIIEFCKHYVNKAEINIKHFFEKIGDKEHEELHEIEEGRNDVHTFIDNHPKAINFFEAALGKVTRSDVDLCKECDAGCRTMGDVVDFLHKTFD